MVMPWRALTLVHAVQRPLCAPSWAARSAGRAALGATDAELAGRARLNAASTGQLDLYARWTEQADRVDANGNWPAQTSHEGHALRRGVDPDWPVLVSLAAVSVLGVGDPPLKHQFGDTRHRSVRYRLKGTTCFREYLPAAVAREDARITRDGPDIVVTVPASARPAVPQLVDSVPTFRWIQTRLTGGGLSRVRRGNGLRVYLQRRWFSSGNGEVLGAVLHRSRACQRCGPSSRNGALTRCSSALRRLQR